jgi:UDP-glucuronate 4-epimerase
MGKYLVTGVAGFIASKVAEVLKTQGHEVVGIDNLNSYYDIRLKDYRLSKLLGKSWQPGDDPSNSKFQTGTTQASGSFSFRWLDIENQAEVLRLFQENSFDAVFNLAARAGVRYSLENPHIYFSTNTVGTLNLLEGMRQTVCKKMVLASTSSLYAGQKMPFNEDLPVNTPLSPYAASKKAAEVLAHSYHHLYGLDISIVRYFTVFGPAGRPDMSIFRFIKWIDEGKPLEIFGDGSQSRDFTFIDDIAEGTILAQKSVGYEIFNLGGGRSPTTLNWVIDYISRNRGLVASKAPPLDFHCADIKETQADTSKASKILGYSPRVSMDVGLQKVLDWHFENQSWLSKIHL